MTIPCREALAVVDSFGHDSPPHFTETMAEPPLLALAGIRFHLGDQTILDGVALAIAPGERLSLVGRNGAGKSTLLRILAGEPIADSGERFAQPGITIATLPQEPDFTGSRQRRRLCRLRADRFAGPVRLPRRRHPRGDEARWRPPAGRTVGRRGAAGGAGPRAGRRARHHAARRADQPSRPADHRMAGGEAVALARRLRAGEPRPALPRDAVARRAVARPRHRPPARQGLRRVRELVERHHRARGDGAAQARSADRTRDRMGRQEHPRPAHAQRGPPARAEGAARAASPADRAGRPRHHRSRPGGSLRRARRHRAQHHQALGRQA